MCDFQCVSFMVIYYSRTSIHCFKYYLLRSFPRSSEMHCYNHKLVVVSFKIKVIKSEKNFFQIGLFYVLHHQFFTSRNIVLQEKCTRCCKDSKIIKYSHSQYMMKIKNYLDFSRIPLSDLDHQF